MVVTIFCYWRFVHIMLSRPQVGMRKHWRAVKLATVTLFNFLVCFGPYNVFLVLRFLKKDSESWQVCAVLLSALSACIDPLIFYFFSSAVRKAFDKRLQSLQSWGASLAGFCKRRAGEPATKRRCELRCWPMSPSQETKFADLVLHFGGGGLKKGKP